MLLMNFPNNNVKIQADKYKKLFEKVVPFYPYQKNNQTYILIRYSRFDKATGDLIVKADGEIIPFNEAAPVFRDITYYDSNIYDSINLINRQKKKSVDELLKKVAHLFEMAVIPVMQEKEFFEIKDDIDRVEIYTKAYIAADKRTQEIVEEYKTMDIQVQDAEARGYLTEADVKRSIELNKEWVLLNYDHLCKARDALESYPRLISFCNLYHDALNLKHADSAGELLEILNWFIIPSNIQVLEDSLKNFEVDETERNPKSFSPGEKGLIEYAENYDKMAKYIFQHRTLPRLRNPK